MPKVSVIIPVYNGEKYIAEAIDSVLAQTYPAHEIIVVDDGSTDRTREIVNSYSVMRTASCENALRTTHDAIRYIYQPNKGPAAARNSGIKEAKGEYIAFLDSDDVWMPEKLEKEIRLITDSDYAMVYCDMSHSVDGKLIYKSYLKEKKYKYVSCGKIYENLLRENFIFTPTVLVRKKTFYKVGYFDETYRICEDYKMWLMIARDYEIGFLDETLVTRRRNKANITCDKLLFINSGIRLFKELLNSNHHSDKTKEIIEGEYRRRFFDLGYYYWDRGDLGRARENFIRTKAFKSTPYIIMSCFPKGWIEAIRRLRKVTRMQE